MEFFVTIVKSCKQLRVVTISSILDVAGVLFLLPSMVLKCTELLKQKRILPDIEAILSESLAVINVNMKILEMIPTTS